MISRFLLTAVVCLLGGDLGGQPPRVGYQLTDPVARRQQRDWAFEYAGGSTQARALVEEEIYGDDAAATLVSISKPVARLLVAFHASGRLAKLPSPQAFLNTVLRNNYRDEMVIFTIKSAEELSDPKCFQAFLEMPLEFVFHLRKLSSGADEVRARRSSSTPCFNHSGPASSSPVGSADLPSPSPSGSEIKAEYLQLPAFNDRALAGSVGLVVFVLLLIWRRRRYLARGLPA